jgi:GNAT superfamily N-acetyltransferase
MPQVKICPTSVTDKDWIAQFIKDHWRSEKIVAHDTIFTPSSLPGFIAIQDKKKVGLITYVIERTGCEIVTLNSLHQSIGVGTALVEAVKKIARKKGCRRVWLITTNDNIQALHFYKKRGFSLAAIHRNALDLSRILKPEIPLIGEHGIPLRDEMELEMKI